MEVKELGEEIHLIKGFLRPAECQVILAKAQQAGFVDLSRQGYDPRYRAGTRAIFDDPELAKLLFDRLAALMKLDREVTRKTKTICHHRPRGHYLGHSMNPHFRISITPPGGHFSPHTDNMYDMVPGRIYGLKTVLIYLKDTPRGGQTKFWEKRMEIASVKPEMGDLVLFDYNIMHEGCNVGKDCEKITLRTDLEYEYLDPKRVTQTKEFIFKD